MRTAGGRAARLNESRGIDLPMEGRMFMKLLHTMTSYPPWNADMHVRIMIKPFRCKLSEGELLRIFYHWGITVDDMCHKYSLIYGSYTARGCILCLSGHTARQGSYA